MTKTKKVLKRKILDEVEINRRSGLLGPEGATHPLSLLVA
jgi:hypothetical protein